MDSSLNDEFSESDAHESKWLPGSWQDGQRKSAFLPYNKSNDNNSYFTVLTNLQRGNTKADCPAPSPIDVNFHTRAGQGEIAEMDIDEHCLNNEIDELDLNGLTALHWATFYGQIVTVQLLISRGAFVNKIGPDGVTPLLLAAGEGHHEVVRYLLTEGAHVNHVDDVGNTPLMYSASGNHPYTCNELLVQGADITIENLCDKTAFDLAVQNYSNLAQAVIENHMLKLIGCL